jgi:hypothetical protein
MPKRAIPPELIIKTRAWLGDDGCKFFDEVKKGHGKINACWDEGGIPHPVHFREGMQIRNFMRTSGLCEDWSDHDFDDNWVELIKGTLNYKVPLNSRYDILKGQE